MDLNLIRVFVAIHETRSLTAAGARLFVTQSAVSQALRRMRDLFDDPLFERTGHGMRPTPLADAVFPGFQAAVSTIEHTMESVHGFDPSTTDRVFRIALSELGEIGWFPAIFAAVHSRAPRARIDVVHLAPADLPEWLDRGAIDLAIVAGEVEGGFARISIKRQAYAVAMGDQNPLARRRLTPDTYREAPRVRVAGDSGAHLLDAAHERMGAVTGELVNVQHFATVPVLLARSRDLVAAVPDTIAAGWMTTWPLVVRELPFVMPPVELNIYRRKTTAQTGALEWFRTTVADVIVGSSGDFAAIHGGGA